MKPSGDRHRLALQLQILTLIPGWPQSWYAWRHVMPLLQAAGRRVVVVDPRGMGDSDRPACGYEMHSVATELHGFLEALDLLHEGPIDVVGHDLGTWLSYALAADWPADVRRLAVFGAALPGITPAQGPGIPAAETNVKTWHFAFNRLDDLPEILLQGQERNFLTWLFRAKAVRPWAINAEDVDEYVRVNAAPGATRAVLNYYRQALSLAGIEESQRRAQEQLAIPVYAGGADGGVGTMLFETMCMIATDVRGALYLDCGHYIPEEAPRAVAQEILKFMPL